MDYTGLQVHNRFHKVAAKPITCFKRCAYRRRIADTVAKKQVLFSVVYFLIFQFSLEKLVK